MIQATIVMIIIFLLVGYLYNRFETTPRCPNCEAERYDRLYKNKHKDDGPPSSTKCPNCGW